MSGTMSSTDQDLTFSELIETSFLKCLMCKSVYQDPRLLPCLHTFCKNCIEDVQRTEDQTVSNGAEEMNGKPAADRGRESKSQENRQESNTEENGISESKTDPVGNSPLEKNDGNKFSNEVQSKYKSNTTITVSLTCPVCKSKICQTIHKSQGFPKNIFMRDLCEMYDYKHEKQRSCDYCGYEGRMTPAKSLCLDCQDNMCQSCTAAHHRTKLTRNHKVITFSQAQKGLYDTDIREYQHQSCPDHQDEPLDMFCEKCEVLMCKDCKVSSHDSHKWSSTEKAAKKYEIQIKNLLQGLHQQIPSIINYLKFLSNYDKSIEGGREKIIKTVNQQAEELHKMIDQQKTAFLETLTEACDKERCELQVKSKNLQTAANSLSNNEEYLRNLLKHGKADEVLILHREITQRLTQLMHMQLDGVTNRLRTDFIAGNNSGRNIQTIFGKLSIDHRPMGQSDGLAAGSALQISTILPNVRNTVELVTEFEANGIQEGKEVWPTGIAVTKYDDFVIVDRDNKRIKIYDIQGKLKQEICGKGDNKLGCPFDVAVLKSGDIAVTDHESEDVKIFTTTGEHIQTIKEDIKYPRGIATNSKGEIVILDCQKQQVTIHDPKTGKMLKTIDGTDTKGSKVLVDPYYITVTAQDNLVITDTAAPNIKVFSLDGKYLANYGHYGLRQDEVLQPYGICCDTYGYLFVADNQNHRIHLLQPDGKFCQFLITKADSLWHPMGLAITQKGYLALTEALGKVKIYKYI